MWKLPFGRFHTSFRWQVDGQHTASRAPEPVLAFARRMADAQGCRVVITQERSGYHLYLPCPACLHEKGKRELSDPKYAINLTKYLRLDRASQPRTGFFPGQISDVDREVLSGVCMRTAGQRGMHIFSIRDLLSMPPIGQRHPDILTRADVQGGAGGDKEDNWVEFKPGVMVPPPPGEVTPITQLPADHPGVTYLLNRGFDLGRLERQFNTGWCHTEWPHRQNKVFYRQFPGGWRDTAQNRIVFYAMHGGVPKTHQARVLEWIDRSECYRYHLHPYTGQWDLTHTRPTRAHEWMLVAPFDEVDSEGILRWKPSKYRTAAHSYRELMGWDAALEAADDPGRPFRWCVLMEGPLDAARIGPGGMAIIGKSISMANAALVAQHFQVAITAFDNDESGRTATETVTKMLLSPSHRNSHLSVVEPMAIPTGKDIGGLTRSRRLPAATLKRRRSM